MTVALRPARRWCAAAVDRLPDCCGAGESERLFVPVRTYHDLFVSYAFDQRALAPLSGLTVQFGVRSVFDKVPPLDVYYVSNYCLSPCGDIGSHNCWLSLQKSFYSA
jgi:hypothetical protein